ALILYALDREASLQSWQRCLIVIGIALPRITGAAVLAHVAPIVMVPILWMACTTPCRPHPTRRADRTLPLKKDWPPRGTQLTTGTPARELADRQVAVCGAK